MLPIDAGRLHVLDDEQQHILDWRGMCGYMYEKHDKSDEESRRRAVHPALPVTRA